MVSAPGIRAFLCFPEVPSPAKEAGTRETRQSNSARMKTVFDLDMAEYPPGVHNSFDSLWQSQTTHADGSEGQNELARTLQKAVKCVKKKVEKFFSNQVARSFH